MIWKWSFRAFRLWGTVVRIHWSLLAFFLYYVVRAFSHDLSPAFVAMLVVTPFVLLFGSVLLHEFGHIFAARHFKLSVGETILTPIGGMVMVGRARTPWSEFWIAAWGPIVNVVLAAAGLLLYTLLGGPISVSMLVPFVTDDAFSQLYRQGDMGLLVLRDFVQTNVMLFVFNVVMVAYPMDGGRMLLAGLWHRSGYRGGMEMACKVSRVMAVLMVVGGFLMRSVLLALIGVFVWMQAAMMLRQLPLLDDPGGGHGSSRRQSLRQREREIRQELKTLRGNWLSRWLEQRETERYVRLLHKAETEGLHSLSDRERAILRRARGKRD